MLTLLTACTLVPFGDGYVQVAVGEDHACTLDRDGLVSCWGSDDAGKSTPPDAAFTAISLGSDHGCGLVEGGEAVCWGSDGHGQASPPQGPFTSVSAGEQRTCGLDLAGELVCWGDTEGPTAGAFLDVGIGAWSCAVGDDEALACWDGAPDLPEGSFLQVRPSLGGRHACAIDTTGSAVCWADEAEQDAEVLSPPAGAFESITPGRSHACALGDDHKVACWGLDDLGQASAPPGMFTQIDAGADYSCGVRKDGSLYCWGSF